MRELDDLDLRIHQTTGAWGIEHRPLLRPGALTALEDAMRALLLAERRRALEDAAQVAEAQHRNAVLATQAGGEWARCATAIAQAIRALIE